MIREFAPDVDLAHAAVLPGYLAGLPYPEIADQLGLSPHTVHAYARCLRRAFGVGSRVELLALAISSAVHPVEPARSSGTSKLQAS
ncbi:MAG: LuxR C-terminal-related transcriptional regulator [Planctomycetota bacterium]